MKLAQKISTEAARIARGYIATLESGSEPPMLSSLINANRGDIIAAIADGRANIIDTLEKVRIQAHYYIKRDLECNQALAARLVAFRAARETRDNEAAATEQRKWRQLPVLA